MLCSLHFPRSAAAVRDLCGAILLVIGTSLAFQIVLETTRFARGCLVRADVTNVNDSWQIAEQLRRYGLRPAIMSAASATLTNAIGLGSGG